MFESVKVAGGSTKRAPDVLVVGQLKGQGLDKGSKALDPDGSVGAAGVVTHRRD